MTAEQRQEELDELRGRHRIATARKRLLRQRFRPDRPTWSWQGLTAFILANAICGGITIICVGIIINIQHKPMPENIGGMLTAIISALIGSVATFLGRVGTDQPKEQQPNESDSTELPTSPTPPPPSPPPPPRI